ncbi:MAG: AsmA family protein [Pseudomonadota bacterium]
MRAFFVGAAVLLALAAGVLFAVPLLVSGDAFKPRLEAAATQALGRTVAIEGDVTFRLLPSLRFDVDGMSVGNPDGFDAPYFAKADSASLGVALVPLLSRDVRLTRFILDRPEIALVKRDDGAVNWIFGAPAPAADEEPGPAEADASEPGAAALSDLRLGDIRIVNGAVRYDDRSTGSTLAIADLNVNAVLKSLDQPLTLRADFVVNGREAALTAVLETPRALQGNERASAKIDARVAGASAAADLSLNDDQAGRFRGTVNADAPDLSAVAEAFGTPLPDAPGLDVLSFEGDLSGSADKMRLALRKFIFDDVAGRADVTLDLTGERPLLSGDVTADAADFRRYTPATDEASAGFPPWSDAPLDFSSLGAVDADINLAAATLQLADLAMSNVQGRIRIDRARLNAELTALTLYGGEGDGGLIVNARGRTPSFSGGLSASGVDAAGLARDVLKNDRLSGTGALDVKFSGSGTSQAAIVKSLDGDGGFAFENGAIRGVNIAKLARSAASLRQGLNAAAVGDALATAAGPDEQTDFSAFNAQFTMENGRMTADAISMTAPYLTMTGGGEIDLPTQSVDLRLAPRVSTDAGGEAGRTATAPIRVTGTFNKLKTGLDVRSAVEDEVRGRVEDVIGGVFGGARQDGAAADADAESGSADGAVVEDAAEAVAGRALDALFGPKKKPAGGEDDDSGDGAKKDKTPER